MSKRLVFFKELETKVANIVNGHSKEQLRELLDDERDDDVRQELFENTLSEEVDEQTMSTEIYDSFKAGLDQLHKLATIEEASKSKEGSIVETSKYYLVLGAALPKLSIGGKEVVGVPSEAKAYKALLGRAAGDEVLNGLPVTQVF